MNTVSITLTYKLDFTDALNAMIQNADSRYCNGVICVVFSLCRRRTFVIPVHECVTIFPVGCSTVMDCAFKIASLLGHLSYSV